MTILKKMPPKIPYIILCLQRDSVLPDCFEKKVIVLEKKIGSATNTLGRYRNWYRISVSHCTDRLHWKLPPKMPLRTLCWKRDSVLPDCLAVNHMILGNKTWHNNHSAFVAEPITGYCTQQYWVLMWPGL